MDLIVKDELDLMDAKDIAQYLADRDECEVIIKFRAVPCAKDFADVPEDMVPSTQDQVFEQAVAQASLQPKITQVMPGLQSVPAPTAEPMPTPPAQPLPPPVAVADLVPPPQAPPVDAPVQAAPMVPTVMSSIDIVRANAANLAGCDEGTLMRLCQGGGYDPDPMVLASQQYVFKDIMLGNADTARLAYLQCAAATAVAEQPQLLVDFGLVAAT